MNSIPLTPAGEGPRDGPDARLWGEPGPPPAATQDRQVTI